MKGMRFWVAMAAASGMTAVAAGAYGYHSLEGDAGMREVFSTAVQYHMWHTLALFGVAWLTTQRTGSSQRWAERAGWLFTTGIVLFSGSLYAFTLMGDVPVPGAAPLGGLSFIAGWAMLAWSAMRKDTDSAEAGGIERTGSNE